MSDADVADAERRFDASRSMLQTVEESLEPMLDESAVLSGLDLTARFGADTRRFARSLVGEVSDASDEQREAFERLFGGELDDSPAADIASTPDVDRARNKLIEFLRWVADLEDRIGGAVGPGGTLERLTGGLVDTISAVGHAIVEHDGVEARRALDETLEEAREMLAGKGLPT